MQNSKKVSLIERMKKRSKLGFSLVELIVVIAIMAILTAILVPAFLQYVEKTRAQKDDSAMSEVTNAVKIAMADQDIYDELLTVESGKDAKVPSGYADAEDETAAAFAGEQRGVTITFRPVADNKKSVVTLADGYINAGTKDSDALDTTKSQLGALTAGDGKYRMIGTLENICGKTITLVSQTYRNSDYTVFIKMGTLGDADSSISVKGEWNGTNLPSGGDSSNPGTEESTPDENIPVGPVVPSAPVLTFDQELSEDSNNPTIVEADSFVLSGTVTDDKGVASLTVNGNDVTVNENGSWSTTLTLTQNVTTEVTIVATDADGNTTTKTGYVGYISYINVSVGKDSYAAEIGYTSSTTELVIPATFEKDGQWYKVTGIIDYGFYNCTNLTSVTIPDGVTSIGNGAFAGCINLALTSLPDGLTSIGNSAFAGCRKLALTSLPSSVTSIGFCAFDSCTNLALTSLPDGLTSIDDYAFQKCEKLALTSLPSGLTSIGDYAFYRSRLALTSLPSGLTSIGEAAFYLCIKLKSITFENTEGWYVTTTKNATSGTDIDVTDPTTNATYLRDSYGLYYWYRTVNE